ncbi:MAG: ATP-binding cassette domain-containing protein [Planctomycetes bacterium]|nr:ATP-binding cassette domain-containing protein [Planctomycetota bacterium]
MQHAVTLDQVTKRFGAHTAVSDLTLRVPTGSIYGFIGQNGAGKTTTIRMIMSIFYPDAGRLTVLGEDHPESVKDRLGYLPEEKGLYKTMRVQEIVAYFGRLKGLDGPTATQRAGELLDRYGLGDWKKKKCQTLSKGMGQKVQILSTIIHGPELVILDEPFSGLDPLNMETMRDTIRDMKREGRTVIFSTHEMERAEDLCDYVFMIHRSKKVFDGPLSEVRKGAGEGIHLAYDGDGRVLDELRSQGLLTRVNDAGKEAELYAAPGVDPQDVLARLVGRIKVRKFDLREPSLHEIFVRRATESEAVYQAQRSPELAR